MHARNLVGDIGHNGECRTDSPIPDTVSPSSGSRLRLPCSHGPLPVVIIRRDVPMDSDRRALNVPADCRTLLDCVDGEPCASGPADAHNRHRPWSRDTLPCGSHGPRLHVRPSDTLRHYEHAHLLSNIEKLPLPIWGSMFPFWNPTGVFPRCSEDNVLRASTRVRRPRARRPRPGPVHLPRLKRPKMVAKT